jgi:8-oxo-dGTP pyrophosphatase MutT (NUDIX family)
MAQPTPSQSTDAVPLGRESAYPSRNIPAPGFVVSAGCILFRHVHTRHRHQDHASHLSSNTTPSSRPRPLQICLIHHISRADYLLPKGRVERSEHPFFGALRETAEETGYALDALRSLPVRMYTRAPAVGAEDSGPTQVEEAVCEEPFMCTIREYGTTVSKRKEGETRTATTDDRLVGHGPRHTKIIWWYLAELIDDDAPSISHEERRDEDKIYRSEFVNASEVLQHATFEQDREILRKALELVKGTYGVE